MAKLRETFKEVITGGKFGLFIGLAIGYAYSKWHHIDAEDAFRYIMLTHMQAGTCIGGVIGGIVKLVRMRRARKADGSPTPTPHPLPEGEGISSVAPLPEGERISGT